MEAPSKKSTANQRKEHNVGKYIQWVTQCPKSAKSYKIPR